MDVMKYYAEQTLQHPIPKSQEGIEDDVLQMGGDFTIKTADKSPIAFLQSLASLASLGGSRKSCPHCHATLETKQIHLLQPLEKICNKSAF